MNTNVLVLKECDRSDFLLRTKVYQEDKVVFKSCRKNTSSLSTVKLRFSLVPQKTLENTYVSSDQYLKLVLV